VRHETDADAAVVAAREWTPYGAPLGEARGMVGGAQAGLGYAGEWFDAEVGLQYLRARWYAVEVGRFTSQDPIPPAYDKPRSFHRYIYVENNAVNLTDPQGLTPYNRHQGNPYDLTLWLYDELSNASNGAYVSRIRLFWKTPDPTALSQIRALLAWTWLVKDKAKWDFKHNIEELLRVDKGQGGVVLRSPGNPQWYEYSAPGNIFYGFVGRAAGFSGALLHMGAGYAEITDPAYKESGEVCCPSFCTTMRETGGWPKLYCYKIGCFHLEWEEMRTLFDDPTDYAMVEFGVRMYNAYGRTLTYNQFQAYLAAHGNELMPAPSIPPQNFTNPDWPYPVGYFNGPDEKENEGLVRILLAK
jgi:RHS repeat-associated protein